MDPKYNGILRELKMVITSEVSMKDDVTKECKGIVDEFLKTGKPNLITAMKQEELFSVMYQELFPAGSMPEGLRVKEATEFDMNLILKFPNQCQVTPQKDIQIETSSNVTIGFARMKLPPSAISLDIVRSPTLNKIVTTWIENLYVKPSKLKEWLEGVVTKGLNAIVNKQDGRYHICGKEFNIDCTKGGPAITLKLRPVSEASYDEISIDLVPVFEFPASTHFPASMRKKAIMDLDKKDHFFFLVPKSPVMDQFAWRIACTKAERSMISGTNSLKLAIKLFKCLREKKFPNHICSYHIKTIAFWLHDQLPPEFFNEKYLGSLFVYMLKIYEKCLANRFLPFYWEPKYNLWANVSAGVLEGHRGQVTRLLNSIDRDPLELIRLFQ